MGRVSATAIEANNRGEGRFRNDQPASTTAWIRMGWGTTETRDDGVWWGSAGAEEGWHIKRDGGGRKRFRNGDNRKSVVGLM